MKKKLGETLALGDVVELDNGYQEKITKRHESANTVLLGQRLANYNELKVREAKQERYLTNLLGDSGYVNACEALKMLEVILALDYDEALYRRECIEGARDALKQLTGLI